MIRGWVVAVCLSMPWVAGAEAAQEDDLPAAAAERQLLAEPMGLSPSPWAALSAALEGGVLLPEGGFGWTSLRVHVPVVWRYAAVDCRLTMGFDDEGVTAIDPVLTLRAMPLRLAGGRGALGLAFIFAPTMKGPEPLMDLSGGVMGGYLGEWWLLRAYLGVGGEVLDQATGVELLATLAAGLRLPYGFRPQVEADLAWQAERDGEVAVTVRPGLRYWPASWIGIGVSSDLVVRNGNLDETTLRLDVVVQARE